MGKTTRAALRLGFWGAAAAVLFAACGGNSSSKTGSPGSNNDAGLNGDASLSGDATVNGSGGNGSGNGGAGNGHGGNSNAGAFTDSGTTVTDGSVNGGNNGDSGVGVINPATCRDIAAACTSNGQCCTGACDPTDHVCIKAPGTCLNANEVCQTGADCCTFSCVGGECTTVQCTADGEACTDDQQCCGGTCDTNGMCAALSGACKTSGNPCNNHTDCCSQYCKDNLCATPSYCTQSGDVCATDQQCCAGLCEKAQGASLGLCGLASASGAGSCLSAGEVCSGGATYDGNALPTCGGECCSKACFPYGPTGVLICEPPSGCHPTGEICTSDVDCCGSATRPDGDASNITCSKDPGSSIGRCENGNSCTPAGGICRLQAVSCSANANCCSGNVLQHDTCKQDNLGIPRCLAAEVDCTNPANYVGAACASSADCCNLPCVANPNGNDPPFVCAAQCVPSSGSCTNTADCCSGVACILPPGSTMGTCGYQQPPPGGPGGEPTPDGGNNPNCADYGQQCVDTSDCCNGVPCANGFCMISIR